MLILIRQGEIKIDMGKKSLSALISMINEPDIVAASNIVELGEKMDISPASITRLVRLFGFSKFNQFQNIFKQRAKASINFYSQKAQFLFISKPETPLELFEKQLDSTRDNINICTANLDNQTLNQISTSLATESRIFIFGHKQSSALASLLKYGLTLIRDNVFLLGQIEHGISTELNQLKKRDLLVLFSSAPYSNLTVEVASLAKSKECKVLAITDSVLSPLNDFASYSIHMPTGGLYYTNNLAANCILVETLLSLTAIQLGNKSIEKLKLHEQTLIRFSNN
ncbi:MAG: MurR/RpiR family transcriptional regulator [Gammaproteobacteria bacterium]|nr:MurR/RpiR family transcriptional regulator [Gammaproteobacteria bacterium]